MSDYPVGLLWQGEGRDWQTEVAAAAAAYQSKFWIEADCCFVRRETVNGESRVWLGGSPELVADVQGVAVYVKDNDLPKNHFFVFNSRVIDPRNVRKGAAAAEAQRLEPVGVVQGELF